jgi:hypothetical protein
MSTHADAIRLHLSRGPAPARQLVQALGISQPTLSRVLAGMGDEVVRAGAARSIHYALRDTVRGLDALPVYRVTTQGQIQPLGELLPVRPEGFVMRQTDGTSRHSEGLPWWLTDMRPRGYLGRAYAASHATALGLPAQLADWQDQHVLRALVAHGHDAVGNLLLGDRARERFLQSPPPNPIDVGDKPEAYAYLAEQAAQGEQPGSSAAGEQPKFAAFAHTANGPAHVLVKFTEAQANPITQRWRDLLLAEHLALQTLGDAGVPAARSQVIDHEDQRFLELERFDRVAPLGRRGLISLEAVEAEFVGDARAPWPELARRLAKGRHVTHEAADGAARLYAFGTLIGNTDMHNGNLSFTIDEGRQNAPVLALAPAYDMLPMGFAPRSGGALPAALPAPSLHPSVPHAAWVPALDWAGDYLARLRAERGFSADFRPCIEALAAHLQAAQAQVQRLA